MSEDNWGVHAGSGWIGAGDRYQVNGNGKRPSTHIYCEQCNKIFKTEKAKIKHVKDIHAGQQRKLS